jgi:hypothetical protein
VALDRGERGHCQRDSPLNLVALFVLGDTPATRTLDRDRSRDCEPDVSVSVTDEIAAFDQFIQVLAALG